MLIDFGSTHNFIHCKLTKILNCFVYVALECQVMIADGGNINYSCKFHNINLAMGEYVLNSAMISIPIGGVDVVLRVQWYNYWEQWILIFKNFSRNFHGKENNTSQMVSQGNQAR